MTSNRCTEEEEEEEECVVCFHTTRTRTHPCRHVVCMECQVRWGRFSCPVCRGATVAPYESDRSADGGVLLQTPADGHAGITIRQHRHGVQVVKLDPLDSAWDAGVRRGDVITHINGLTIRDPQLAASVLDAMRGASLHLSIRRRPRFFT